VISRHRFSCIGVRLALVLVLAASGQVHSEGCGDEVMPDSDCSPEDESSDPGSTSSGVTPPSTVGNPISLMSGNKQQAEEDFAVPDSQLVFRRVYNSLNTDWNVGLGPGWHHTYAVSLYDAGKGAREIVQSDGRRLRFEPDGVDDEGRSRLRGVSASDGVLSADEDKHVWHMADGRQLHFRGSFLVRIDWPDQRELRLFYRQGRLSTVTDEAGRVLRLEFSGGERALPGFEQQRYAAQTGQLNAITLPDGKRVEFAYDERRNLTRARYPDGNTREYHYEDTHWPHHLTGLTDRTGVRFASWEYDDHGRARLSEHANGVERVSIIHPDPVTIARGDIVETRVNNSLDQQSVYRWVQTKDDAEPRLLSSRGAGCASCPPTGLDFDYDLEGRLTSIVRSGTGASGGLHTSSLHYDDLGRLTEIRRTESTGETRLVERRGYEGDSLQPGSTRYPSVNPEGEHVVEVHRDADGRTLSIAESGFSPDGDGQFLPVSRTTRFGYDGKRLVAIDGPREDVDDVTRFAWNDRHQLIEIAPPGQPALRVVRHDDYGRPLEYRLGSSADTARSPVQLAYNVGGRVSRVSHRGQSIELGYDAEQRLISFVDTKGKRFRARRDEAGRIEQWLDDRGRAVDFELDTESRLIGQTWSGMSGEVTRSLRHLFDASGRAESSAISVYDHASGNPVQQNLSYLYGADNRLAAAVDDGTGARATLEYDALDEVLGWSMPADPVAERHHDHKGQEIGLTDVRSNRTDYLKDDFGRVVRLDSPDTGVSDYRYDAADNRIYKRDADGEVTTYNWDEASRLVRKESSDGVTTYAYDSATGQLVHTANIAGEESFSYNDEAQLVEHTRRIDDRTFVTAYVYGADGQLQGKTLPNGVGLRYHYHEDGANRGELRAVTQESLFGLRQETLIAEIDLDGRDGQSGHLSHNGLRTRRDVTPDGRITSIDVAGSMRLDYRYDDAGRIVGIDDGAAVHVYGYDSGRLSNATLSGRSYRFGYDAIGNRTSTSVSDSEGAVRDERHRHAAPGDGNRLIETVDQMSGLSETYRFSANGAPIEARDELRYEYNTDQRPVRVYQSDELLAEYAYNSFGERIRKVVYRGDQKRVTYFLYDGHELTAEIDGDSGAYKQTVFLDSQPVAFLDGNDIHAIHIDQLGTPRLLTDSRGEVVWRANYTPFGEAEVLIDTVEFAHRLPGQYADAETGTHYNYYRDYDPATGRYLTSDPIGLKGGINTYAYVENDPLGQSDVLGLAPGDTDIVLDGVQKPIADADYLDKLKFVLLEAARVTGGEVVGIVEQMVQPENLASMAIMMGAITAAQAVPGLNAVVDAALLG